MKQEVFWTSPNHDDDYSTGPLSSGKRHHIITVERHHDREASRQRKASRQKGWVICFLKKSGAPALSADDAVCFLTRLCWYLRWSYSGVTGFLLVLRWHVEVLHTSMRAVRSHYYCSTLSAMFPKTSGTGTTTTNK